MRFSRHFQCLRMIHFVSCTPTTMPCETVFVLSNGLVSCRTVLCLVEQSETYMRFLAILEMTQKHIDQQKHNVYLRFAINGSTGLCIKLIYTTKTRQKLQQLRTNGLILIKNILYLDIKMK